MFGDRPGQRRTAGFHDFAPFAQFRLFVPVPPPPGLQRGGDMQQQHFRLQRPGQGGGLAADLGGSIARIDGAQHLFRVFHGFLLGLCGNVGNGKPAFAYALEYNNTAVHCTLASKNR